MSDPTTHDDLDRDIDSLIEAHGPTDHVNCLATMSVQIAHILVDIRQELTKIRECAQGSTYKYVVLNGGDEDVPEEVYDGPSETQEPE